MPHFHSNQLVGWGKGGGDGDRRPRCPTSGKEMHGSEAEAERAAARGEERSEIPLGTYYCFHCGAWHLTSRERGRR